MGGSKRSLTDLMARSELAFQKGMFQRSGKQSPTAAYDHALSSTEDEELARSCRFAAILHRDYGEETFRMVLELFELRQTQHEVDTMNADGAGAPCDSHEWEFIGWLIGEPLPHTIGSFSIRCKKCGKAEERSNCHTCPECFAQMKYVGGVPRQPGEDVVHVYECPTGERPDGPSTCSWVGHT